MNAIRIAARSGLRAMSRQATLAVPRAPAMASMRAGNVARTFAMTSRRLNESSDSQLSSILSGEIKLEQENFEPVPASVSEFLKESGFSIIEKEGLDEVELVKKAGSETVHVFFSVSDITNGSEHFLENMNEEGAEAEEEEGFDVEMPPVRANIVIEKPAGALGVECVVQNNVVIVESITPYPSGEVALSNTAESDYKRREIYQGPPFANLDENVQSSFEQYLESRGINSDLADFVIEYSSHRENKEYFAWLNKFKTFVEA